MARLPSKPEIMDWLEAHPSASSKRDIAKAFGLKGAERVELKRLLAELEDDGRLERRRRHYRDAPKLPPVTVVELKAPDASGESHVSRVRSSWRMYSVISSSSAAAASIDASHAAASVASSPRGTSAPPGVPSLPGDPGEGPSQAASWVTASFQPDCARASPGWLTSAKAIFPSASTRKVPRSAMPALSLKTP